MSQRPRGPHVVAGEAREPPHLGEREQIGNDRFAARCSRWRGRDADRRNSCRFADRSAPPTDRCCRETTRTRAAASARHSRLPSARQAASAGGDRGGRFERLLVKRHAGCWRLAPKLCEPTGRKKPASLVCNDMSQRSDLKPAAVYAGVPVEAPVTIKACGKRALSYASSSSNHTQSCVSTDDSMETNLSASRC